jgi:hypothetical protein
VVVSETASLASSASPDPPAASSASSSSYASSDSCWETDDEDDPDAPFVPRPLESLFCWHESESAEANVEFMRTAHGFVLPYREFLVDLPGLLARLQRKIHRERRCVFCDRKFTTLEAVRGHMRDAGHVKIRYDPPAVFRANPTFDAADLAELRDPLDAFYDFGEDDQGEGERAAGGFAEESETESGASSSNNPNRTLATLATRGAGRATRTANGSELILPGAGSSGGGASGRRRVLGHRAYRRYYRQSYRADYVAAGGNRSDERRVERRQPAQRLATRESQKRQNQIATRAMRHAKAGASKALAAQFSHKAGFADNAARRAIVHHWGAGGGGSHYHTAGSKQFLKGVRIRGVVSRHSKQGAKMQAARVQAARNKQNRGNASVAVLRSSTRKG